jgi:predicted ester cyclase
MADVAPTGREATGTGIDIVRLEDGKLAELWQVTDQLGLMQPLGATPAMAQAEA